MSLTRRFLPLVLFAILIAVALAWMTVAPVSAEDTPTVTPTATATPIPGSVSFTLDAPAGVEFELVAACFNGGKVALSDASSPRICTLEPGEHSFRLRAKAGYVVMQIDCGPSRFYEVELPEQRVTVDVRSGIPVVCTITVMPATTATPTATATNTPAPTSTTAPAPTATPVPILPCPGGGVTVAPNPCPPSNPVQNIPPTFAPTPPAVTISPPNTGDGGLLVLAVDTPETDSSTLLIGIAAAPVIAALVQVLKGAFPFDNRFLPLATLAVGIAWVNGSAIAAGDWTGALIVVGVLTGLGATGLYELTTKSLANKPTA